MTLSELLLSLYSIYKRDYLGRTRDEIVFEFSDE